MDVRTIADTPTHTTFCLDLSDAESTVYFDRAAASVSTKHLVKGFRPGQAPWNILEKTLPRDTMYQEVAQAVLKGTLPELLRAHAKDRRRLGDPSIEFKALQKDKGIRYEISIAFWPMITLPEYKKLTVTQQKAEVSDKEVDGALDYLKKARKSQTIDDAFARNVGNFKDIGALKHSIREGIAYDKTSLQTEKSRGDLLEKIRKGAGIEIAPFLIDREAQKILDYEREQIQKNGSTIEEYLKNIGKSEQDFAAHVKEIAKKRLENALLLYEIAKQENITVSEDEVVGRLNQILSRLASVAQAKGQLDPATLKDRLYQQILEEKVFSEVLDKQIVVN